MFRKLMMSRWTFRRFWREEQKIRRRVIRKILWVVLRLRFNRELKPTRSRTRFMAM